MAQGAAPEVLRVCEESKQLGVGVACPLGGAVANAIVGTSPTAVSFTCPAVRDQAMIPGPGGTLVPTASPGVGGYSLYQAAMGTLDPADATPAAVTCTGF